MLLSPRAGYINQVIQALGLEEPLLISTAIWASLPWKPCISSLFVFIQVSGALDGPYAGGIGRISGAGLFTITRKVTIR